MEAGTGSRSASAGRRAGQTAGGTRGPSGEVWTPGETCDCDCAGELTSHWVWPGPALAGWEAGETRPGGAAGASRPLHAGAWGAVGEACRGGTGGVTSHCWTPGRCYVAI